MKKIIKKNKTLILLTLFIFPTFSYAMSINVENTQEEIRANDVAILDFYINTDGKEINVIDGTIKILGEYEIKNLNTAGSVFSLWPTKPVYSQQKISFIGGTPSGVTGSKLKVFSIAIQPLNSQEINFSSENISVFLNDGAGTRVVLEKINKNIEVLASNGESKNGLDRIISEDKIVPEDFEIIIGKEKNLFDGKYFASFYTVDNQSGINRYEVLEEGYDWIVSENTYVLRSQNINGEISVRAIDNAGNVRTVENKTKDPVSNKEGRSELYAVLSATTLLIIYFMYNYMRRKNDKS